MKTFQLILCMIFSFAIVSIPILSTFLFTDLFTKKNETLTEESETVTRANKPNGSDFGVVKCSGLSDYCGTAYFTPTIPVTTTQWFTTELLTLEPGIGINFESKTEEMTADRSAGSPKLV